jgi:hypothetical protein
MSYNSEQSGSSTIVAGMLGVSFVVLKLCNVINWSWWWVTLPFWGGPALALILLVVVLIYKIVTKH